MKVKWLGLLVLIASPLMAEHVQPGGYAQANYPQANCRTLRFGNDSMIPLPALAPEDRVMAVAPSARFAVVKRGNRINIEGLSPTGPTGQTFAQFNSAEGVSVDYAEISPDEQTMMLVTYYKGQKRVRLIGLTGPQVVTNWTMDGRTLAAAAKVPLNNALPPSLSGALFVRGAPGVVAISAYFSGSNTNTSGGITSGTRTIWVDSQGQVRAQFPDVKYQYDAAYCAQGQTIFAINEKKNVFMQRMGSQGVFYPFGEKKIIRLETSPYGNTGVALESDGQAFLFSCASGQILGPLPRENSSSPSNTSVKLSPDGRLVAISLGTTMRLYDLQTRQAIYETTIPEDGDRPVFSPDGQRLVWMGSDSMGGKRLYQLSTQTSCIPFSFRVASGGAPGPLTDQAKAECTRPFSAESWRAITGGQTSGELSVDTALAYLYQFQKTSAFSATEHASIFLAILNSPLVTQYPNLISGALQNILTQSIPLYESIVNSHPHLRSLPYVRTIECATNEELQNRVNWAFYYLHMTRQIKPGATTLKDWANLAPLAPIFGKIQKSALEDVVADISRSMAAHAESSKELAGVFTSSVVYFSKTALYRLLGQPAPPLTDMLLVREGSDLEPVVLGTGPINGNTSGLNSYGFYSYRLPKYSLKQKQPVQQQFQWTHDGEQFGANLSAIPHANTQLVYQGRTFPYERFWADGNLEGMIMVGTNTRGSQSAVTMDQYRNYFQQQGFQFSGLQTVSDFPDHLRQRLSSNRLDYFLMEGHTAGNQRDVMRIESSTRLMTGVRRLPDGRTETIHLVFPTEAATPARSISWQQFGEWMRARDGQVPGSSSFAFFNFTCGAASKTMYEVEHASNPNIINIPNLSTCYNFANAPDNQIKLLLDGFRGGYDFESIRRGLKYSSTYDPGKRGAIFPDEKAYYDNITSKIDSPYQINLEMYDRSGQPYRVEDRVIASQRPPPPAPTPTPSATP